MSEKCSEEKMSSVWNTSKENWNEVPPGLRQGYGPEQLFDDIQNAVFLK